MQADEEAIVWLARLRGPEGKREQATFEEWYASNPLNADAYDRALASWDRLSAASKIPLAQSRLPLVGADPSTRWKRYALGAAAAAAIITVVAVGGRQFGLGQDPLISAAYASGVGEIRTITLPDGSRVTLDTDTEVRTAYTDDARRVRLVRGRARFAVLGNRRAFIVDAGNHLLAAIGASFDVDMTDHRLAVTLYKGHADVTGPSIGPRQSLASGQTLTIVPGRPSGMIGHADASEARWTSGILSFENSTLQEVVDRANRYGQKKIILTDESARRRRYTGTARAGATEELAKMLAEMFNLVLTRDRSGNLILSVAAP